MKVYGRLIEQIKSPFNWTRLICVVWGVMVQQLMLGKSNGVVKLLKHHFPFLLSKYRHSHRLAIQDVNELPFLSY